MDYGCVIFSFAVAIWFFHIDAFMSNFSSFDEYVAVVNEMFFNSL